MRQPLALAVVGVVGIGIGFVLSGGVGGSEAAGEVPGADFPMAIQQAWFAPVSDYDNGGEPLDDARFDALMSALDDALTAEETLADFEREADIHLWSFTRRLVVPEVTGAQMERIGSYLDDLAEQHPDHVDVIDYRRDFLPSYAPSRPTAPPLTLDLQLFGDTDRYPNNGEPFRTRRWTNCSAPSTPSSTSRRLQPTSREKAQARSDGSPAACSGGRSARIRLRESTPSSTSWRPSTRMPPNPSRATVSVSRT